VKGHAETIAAVSEKMESPGCPSKSATRESGANPFKLPQVPQPGLLTQGHRARGRIPSLWSSTIQGADGTR
jgi:hypothetical protein